MKCLLVLVLWLGAELADAGALRCIPGEDSTCITEDIETEHDVQLSKRSSEKEAASHSEDVVKQSQLAQGQLRQECATGSRWVSRCNQCHCAAGRAVCTDAACPGHESEPERRCAPDTEWYDACNTCWCLDDGLAAVCTRVGCGSNIVTGNDKNLSTKPVLEGDMNNGSETKINAKKKEDASRLASKHRSEVVNVDDTEHPDVEIEKENLETLDHSFEELDYNNYVPENNLNHVHTIQDQDNVLEESYVEDKEDKHSLLKRSVCKPGEVFQAECNACNCAPDGQSYTCTHNECMEGDKNKEVEVFMESEGVDHIERHTVCAARGTFYIGCNTCHCNALGTDYSCTNKPCPLPEDVELFHELKTVKASSNTSRKRVCVANRMFIKDCNTCWCNEDGSSFFCTRKVCVPDLPEEGSEDKPEELRVILKECRPDEVFELDCNMCRCNPDGKSYSCTRRACVDPDQPVVEPVDHTQNAPLIRKTRGAQVANERKNCEPGSEFRLDCNTCLCDNEGRDFSCTRRDCYQPSAASEVIARVRRDTSTTETVAMTCVADSVFDRECNVCRCASDGRHAQCTRHACVAPTSAPDTTPASSEADPNFRCSPGEQLKRGCNDCQCSADGRSVFCTVRFCDQDITPPPSI